MKKMVTSLAMIITMMLWCSTLFSQPGIEDQIVTEKILKFEKVEFDVVINTEFENPFDSRDIQLDMIITTPSGPEREGNARQTAYNEW